MFQRTKRMALLGFVFPRGLCFQVVDVYAKQMYKDRRKKKGFAQCGAYYCNCHFSISLIPHSLLGAYSHGVLILLDRLSVTNE